MDVPSVDIAAGRAGAGMVFELCAETIDACLAAREGGAHRIELCSGLSEGGVTPSHGLISEAVDRSGLPVHVLVRPRGGNFVYSVTEIDVMRRDILHIKELGAAGVVFGILQFGPPNRRRNNTCACPVRATAGGHLSSCVRCDSLAAASAGRRDRYPRGSNPDLRREAQRSRRIRSVGRVGSAGRSANRNCGWGRTSATECCVVGEDYPRQTLSRIAPPKAEGACFGGENCPAYRCRRRAHYVVDADAVRALIQRLERA